MMDSGSLRIYPDDVIRAQALVVNEIIEDIQLLIDRMIDLMLEYIGIGLSALQIGILKRINVIKDQDEFIVLIIAVIGKLANHT